MRIAYLIAFAVLGVSSIAALESPAWAQSASCSIPQSRTYYDSWLHVELVNTCGFNIDLKVRLQDKDGNVLERTATATRCGGRAHILHEKTTRVLSRERYYNEDKNVVCGASKRAQEQKSTDTKKPKESGRFSSKLKAAKQDAQGYEAETQSQKENLDAEHRAGRQANERLLEERAAEMERQMEAEAARERKRQQQQQDELEARRAEVERNTKKVRRQIEADGYAVAHQDMVTDCSYGHSSPCYRDRCRSDRKISTMADVACAMECVAIEPIREVEDASTRRCMRNWKPR